MKLRRYVPEIIILVYAILFLLTKNPSNQWDRVIVSDGKGYYGYLPAVFIYHDTDYGFIDKYESGYYPASGQLFKDFMFDTGHGIINKYFPGPALLWLPFFGAAHAAAVILGFPTDGYSLPYQWAIAIAAFFYFWLALLILRKVLRFFTDNETAIAWSLAATALATNLVYYTVNAGSQVHVYNFFLLTAFIYSILAASKKGKPAFFVSAAFLLGMAIISRPQNGLIVLAVPFLCGNREAFFLFLKRVFTDLRILLPAAFALLIPLLVPVTYWYLKTGHYLVYSYGSEAYDLSKPHLMAFLFSFEKGWLLYTPMAAFASLGFVYLWKKNRWQFFCLSAFLFFLVYFMSSWWIWTYTSYISQRVMIDYYAFLAIFLIFLYTLLENSLRRMILPLVLLSFMVLNLAQYIQQLIWVYPAGPVTPRTYFENFFSFSKGTTFMIPKDEILGKQSYTTDFESNKPLFLPFGFKSSSVAHSGKSALVLDSVSQGKPLFIRSMTDYRETRPLILKIGGWYRAESNDSSLLIDVSIGNYKAKYSSTHHDLMPGLITGKWKYAEMVVYLPVVRSVSDSLFISCQNLSKGKVLLDDLDVEFLKMRGPVYHDWILKAEDPIDSVLVYRTNLETPPEAPWGNPASVSTQQAFSGKKSSCIQPSSPYSLVFEKETDFSKKDGYIRVCSRILGENSSEVKLVFDFTASGKTVFYKTYPVAINDSESRWSLSEMFRELPVARLKAQKVKIYYWYTHGNNPVYIDDMQVDMVTYKPAKLARQAAFPPNENAVSLLQRCCDFENPCLPESGVTQSVPDAYSGSKACMINAEHPFSFSYLLPLSVLKTSKEAFVYISAKVNSDQYTTGTTLVADFRHGGRSVSYKPAYLHEHTIKGEWNNFDFGVKVPGNVSADDSVLVYFYLAKPDEEVMIDDFCVSIKKPLVKKAEMNK